MTSRHANLGTTPRTPRASAEMNLTPLIDVLLVLLIIFMTGLNLTQQGVDVSLPPVEDPSSSPAPPTSVMVEYTGDRRLSINSQPVDLASLEARLRDIFASRRDRTLFVRGDAALRYGEVVTIFDAARGAGVTRVGVVTPGMIKESQGR